MNSTPPSASTRRISANRVTRPLHPYLKLVAEALKILKRLHAFLHSPPQARIDQREIHIPLVYLDDRVDRVHGSPSSYAPTSPARSPTDPSPPAPAHAAIHPAPDNDAAP